ncbi:MAG: hypothetical protein ACI9JR_003182, partial [Gammaproteobacteria bacterium]
MFQVIGLLIIKLTCTKAIEEIAVKVRLTKSIQCLPPL